MKTIIFGMIFIGFIFFINGLTTEVKEIKEKYNSHNGETLEEQLNKYN